MPNLDYDTFLKKYSLAISHLEKRLDTKESKTKLAMSLYQDMLNNKINMDTVTNDVKLFFQGNTLSQLKLNDYVQKYK